MSLLATLKAQLQAFDDAALEALANRGLLRRARKDLESTTPALVTDDAGALVVAVGDQHVRFDARGAMQARCSCPADSTCQHILAAILWLQRDVGAGAAAVPAVAQTTPMAADDGAAIRAALHAALMAMGGADFGKHAGKAGWRWAWQFVQDLAPAQAPRIAGDRNISIEFVQPRLAFRYVGGGLGDLMLDGDVGKPEKFRVAAVLAYQRAHGLEPPPPDAPAPRNAALDLGMDHALPDVSPAALRDARSRHRAAVAALLADGVRLGLSHLSQNVQERCATLAVWAQGVDYPRLALSLRRIADHVELLLARAGGADEHRLLDEMALAFALVSALDAAEAQGRAPPLLTGRARRRYDGGGLLDVVGMGALPWRSASGYVGLTMLFWWPDEARFLACTDARPESQHFDARARYRAAGPWRGLGAPEQASGRRLQLADAALAVNGRLSASERTQAVVHALDAAALRATLAPNACWSEVRERRAAARRSLLAEPDPMADWIVLRPAACERAQFDRVRQVLVWPLVDSDGDVLPAEIPWSEAAAFAIARVEAVAPADFAGTWVVAKLRGEGPSLVAEPLSLLPPPGVAAEPPIDVLHFDVARDPGVVAKLRERWLRSGSARHHGAMPAAATVPTGPPPALHALAAWLQRQAERGLGDAADGPTRASYEDHRQRLAAAGLNAWPALAADEALPPALLRAHYLLLQTSKLRDPSAGERFDDGA